MLCGNPDAVRDRFHRLMQRLELLIEHFSLCRMERFQMHAQDCYDDADDLCHDARTTYEELAKMKLQIGGGGEDGKSKVTTFTVSDPASGRKDTIVSDPEHSDEPVTAKEFVEDSGGTRPVVTLEGFQFQAADLGKPFLGPTPAPADFRVLAPHWTATTPKAEGWYWTIPNTGDRPFPAYLLPSGTVLFGYGETSYERYINLWWPEPISMPPPPERGS